MPYEEAFLNEILANPGDAPPRLIYADWLMDRDNPLGEFIAVQCELAHLDQDANVRPKLEMREHALLAQNQDAWLGTLSLRRRTSRMLGISWRSGWRLLGDRYRCHVSSSWYLSGVYSSQSLCLTRSHASA